MEPHKRTLQWMVWGGLAAVILTISAAFALSQLRSQRLRPDRPLFRVGPVGPFELTNQLGRVISDRDFRDHVWLVDIIFTRCPGPCAYMTRGMRELQEAIPEDWPVRLVSLTTDPAYDTPEVLQAYAARHQADPARWWFLTGPKSEIQRLAVDQLKLVAEAKPEPSRETPDDLFIHSTLLVLVDRQGFVRAGFESLPDMDQEEGAERPSSVERFRPVKEEVVKTLAYLLGTGPLLTVRDLPAVNASLNGLSALLLMAGYYWIRRGNREAHRACMLAALGSSVLFLTCYVTYHANVGHTSFQNPSWFRPYYLALLISHVLLAVAIVPLVLMTVARAVRGRFEAHKKLARYTWPLWMYVSVTGVMIYFLLYWIFPQ